MKPSTDPPRSPRSDLPATVVQLPGTQAPPLSAPRPSDVTGAYGAAPPARTGPSPEHIGKYEVVRALGDGGQAIAYLAFDPDLKRQVVLKVYHAARTAAEQEMVLKEGQALARVRSGYVAQCYSAERHDEVPYLVMEYIPGRSLAEVQRGGPLDLDRSLELVGQLAEGLSAVHACGLLHRDIKPSNVIVGDDGVPRLVDFGLAEPLASAALSRVSGTIPYMAPEQARGESDRIGPPADLFALGAVLYELLTGRPPYQGETRQELMRQACAGDVVPPRERNPKVPAAVNDVCVRCLAKDQGDRFASATDLAAAVRRCRPRGWRGLNLAFRLGRYKIQLAIGATVALALLLLTPLAFQLDRASRQQQQNVAMNAEPRPEAPPGDAGLQADATRRAEPPPPAAAPRRPLAMTAKLARARHPANDRELRQDFALGVQPVNGVLAPDGKLVLKQGDALALRVEVERPAYLGVWFARQDGTVLQLLPNERELAALVPAGRPRTVPQPVDETLTAGAPADGLEYLQLRAATRPWTLTQPGRRPGPPQRFPLFSTPEEKKAIREFLLQPFRIEDRPGNDEAPPAVSEVVVPVQVR